MRPERGMHIRMCMGASVRERGPCTSRNYCSNSGVSGCRCTRRSLFCAISRIRFSTRPSYLAGAGLAFVAWRRCRLGPGRTQVQYERRGPAEGNRARGPRKYPVINVPVVLAHHVVVQRKLLSAQLRQVARREGAQQNVVLEDAAFPAPAPRPTKRRKRWVRDGPMGCYQVRVVVTGRTGSGRAAGAAWPPAARLAAAAAATESPASAWGRLATPAPAGHRIAAPEARRQAP